MKDNRILFNLRENFPFISILDSFYIETRADIGNYTSNNVSRYNSHQTPLSPILRGIARIYVKIITSIMFLSMARVIRDINLPVPLIRF
jgi:hypothetical protein